MPNWLQRVAARINTEYDRRIRRASQISEYGAPHPHAGDEEDETVEIVNVPRGSIVTSRNSHTNETEQR